MAVRRLYEPLCIAFGTTVSSPTVPTYQLYDLPHKFTPRLYMESEDPNLVLREIGVWAGWEQAGSANTRSFLLDLLKDEDAHDNFLVREAGPTRFRGVGLRCDEPELCRLLFGGGWAGRPIGRRVPAL